MISTLELNELKARFLAGLDRLEETNLGADQRECVAIIRESASQLVETVGEAFDAPASGAAVFADKSHLLAKRAILLDAMFSAGLSAPQNRELAAIECHLNELETGEADEFDKGYAESRAGKIESALDRLEALVRAGENTK